MILTRPPGNGIVGPRPIGGCGTPPSGISGLQLWLDATALALSDGDQVSTWADCSGNSNDATGVTVSTKPIYKATLGPSSKPTVLMVDDSGTPVGGYFSLPNAFGSLPSANIYAVVQKTVANDNSAPPFADFGSDTSSGDLYAFSDARIFSAFGSTARKDCGNGYTANITTWCLAEARSASGAWSFWLNGTQIFSTGTNTVGWSSAPFIGHRSAGNANMRGYISEVGLYTSLDNYTNFKSYINTKWGITLA